MAFHAAHKIGQIVQRGRYRGMFGAERSLPNLYGAPVKRLRLSVSTFQPVLVRQIVETQCRIGMIRSKNCFADP